MSGIVTGTRDRCKIRPGLPQTYRGDRPSADCQIRKAIQMRTKLAVLPHRQVIHRREQETVASRPNHIAAIGCNIKTVRHRRAVNNLGIEGCRRIATHVAKVLGPHVARLKRQSSPCTHVQFRLQPVIAHMAIVGRRQNPLPIQIRLWIRVRRNGARLQLIQVHGLAHAVRTHAHIALAQCEGGSQFAFHSKIPLRGLWIAVVRQSVLIEIASSGNGRGTVRCSRAWKLICWLVGAGGQVTPPTSNTNMARTDVMMTDTMTSFLAQPQIKVGD